MVVGGKGVDCNRCGKVKDGLEDDMRGEEIGGGSAKRGSRKGSRKAPRTATRTAPETAPRSSITCRFLSSAGQIELSMHP